MDISDFHHDDHDAPLDVDEVSAQFCTPFHIRLRDIDKADLENYMIVFNTVKLLKKNKILTTS